MLYCKQLWSLVRRNVIASFYHHQRHLKEIHVQVSESSLKLHTNVDHVSSSNNILTLLVIFYRLLNSKQFLQRNKLLNTHDCINPDIKKTLCQYFCNLGNMEYTKLWFDVEIVK